MQLDGVFPRGLPEREGRGHQRGELGSLSEDRVNNKFVSRRGFFRSILTDMIHDRENFITEPAEARDVLANAKITDISVVMSGHTAFSRA